MSTGPPVTEIRWALAPPPDDLIDPDPLVDAIIESLTYRELAQQAMHALAAVTHDYKQMQDRHRFLRHRR